MGGHVHHVLPLATPLFLSLAKIIFNQLSAWLHAPKKNLNQSKTLNFYLNALSECVLLWQLRSACQSVGLNWTEVLSCSEVIANDLGETVIYACRFGYFYNSFTALLLMLTRPYSTQSITPNCVAITRRHENSLLLRVCWIEPSASTLSPSERASAILHASAVSMW